ncbi:aldehyde dehydrogenase family protein, partial [Enterococcus faecalis]
LEEGVFLGPVIRKEAQQRTFDYIQKGIDEGADLLLDGRENIPEKGYFVGPTIFDRVTMDMKIWQDEIFAPVASIVRVKNLEAAVT